MLITFSDDTNSNYSLFQGRLLTFQQKKVNAPNNTLPRHLPVDCGGE